MMNLFRDVLTNTVERISMWFSTYAPSLLAGLLIILLAYVVAFLARWILRRIFHGISMERFLRESGLSSMLGKISAVDLAANAAFWFFFLGGVLTAISAFDTQITNQITEIAIYLFPKLLAAAGIIIAGIWLGRFLGRHILVWAVNEGIPWGRRLAAAVRALVVFVAVVAAADHLNFARNVFLAVLILVVGGIVLSLSLVAGLYGKEMLKRSLEEKPAAQDEKRDMAIWRHL